MIFILLQTIITFFIGVSSRLLSRLSSQQSSSNPEKSSNHPLKTDQSDENDEDSGSPVTNSVSPPFEPPPPDIQLTTKDLYIELRNRIYGLEEQMWLHKIATAQEKSHINRLIPQDMKEYRLIVALRNHLRRAYPSYQMEKELQLAKIQKNILAEEYLTNQLQSFQKEIPLSTNHVNQLLLSRHYGEQLVFLHGAGAAVQRVLPARSIRLRKRNIQRQYQLQCFSNSGKKAATIELQYNNQENKIIQASLLTYDVVNDPVKYGLIDSTVRFEIEELPGIPVFVEFTPNEKQIILVMLPYAFTSNSNNLSEQPPMMLMIVDYEKVVDDSRRPRSERYFPFSFHTTDQSFALPLSTAEEIYLSFTTSHPDNATIVARFFYRDENNTAAALTGRKAPLMNAVYVLRDPPQDCQDKSNAWYWDKISESTTSASSKRSSATASNDLKTVSDMRNTPSNVNSIKWKTPICHSAGGGDNVLVIEDGYLVTKAISPWKRDPLNDDLIASKRLKAVKGYVDFLVSPDNSKAVILEHDANIGHYAVTVIEGEDALDPLATSSFGKVYELPFEHVISAFWFSPDSSKLLCLASASMTKEDVMVQKGKAQLPVQSEMQWLVYHFPLQEALKYDTCYPTAYFMKHIVPHFTQYARVRIDLPFTHLFLICVLFRLSILGLLTRDHSST